MDYSETPSGDQNLRPVPGFPGYSVSRFGRVFNDVTNHEMTQSPNQRGELSVGLMREGRQVRIPVRNIVAETFVPGKNEINDTPMLLDGNRLNLRADNIVWRPRWFVWKHMRQFSRPPEYAGMGPIVEVTTNNLYHNIAHAAVANGELMEDIALSIYNETYVYPNRHKYVRAQRE